MRTVEEAPTDPLLTHAPRVVLPTAGGLDLGKRSRAVVTELASEMRASVPNRLWPSVVGELGRELEITGEMIDWLEKLPPSG